MSTGERLNLDLITEIQNALERHGYRRSGDWHIGRGVRLILDLAGIYEGTQDGPLGAYLVRTPAIPVAALETAHPEASEVTAIGAAGMRKVLAALDEAADHKRDLAANCAECPDQTCGVCRSRLQAARSYDIISARLADAAYGAAPEHQVRPRVVQDREAAQ